MSNDTVVQIRKEVDGDSLTALLREGARQLLQTAIEAELEELLAAHRDTGNAPGRCAVVRNGYLPERQVLTGIGPVAVKVPKVRDRSGEGVVFRSSLVPPYVRKARSIDAALPWLYLKGISTGNMQQALSVLVGQDAVGLSPAVVSRLKAKWIGEYHTWRQHTLAKERFVYLWADGIYSSLRAEDQRLCLLVVIGVNDRGQKQFLAIEDGVRESSDSWRAVLRDLKHRGLSLSPKLAVGDGALGFWAALEEIYPETRHQRCWVHKTVNILNYLPRAVQPKAKAQLQEIWMAETEPAAEQAFDHFIEVYAAKYPKAVECLAKDREVLLAFYDFRASHWAHLRTTNPIESAFATIRHRTDKTKGSVSRATLLALVYKLAMSAEQSFMRLRGFALLADVIAGVKFKDGLRQDKKSEEASTMTTEPQQNAA